jgi:hypothetical protein
MLKEMLANGNKSMDLPLIIQLDFYQGHDQIISIDHEVIKQVCWLKTLIGLCPATKYNEMCGSFPKVWNLHELFELGMDA